MHSHDQTALAESQTRDALANADALRIAGRWGDASALLRGAEPAAALAGREAQGRRALAAAQVLADQHIFARVKSPAERERLLDEAMAHADAVRSDPLRAAVWDAKGWSLHAAFITAEDQEENPDELACFERGLAMRRAMGNQRDIAESLFHVGLVYGVVRDDDLQGMPYFQQAYDLAKQAGDTILQSYAIRHLGYAKHIAGDESAAHAGMLESLRLREEAGFVPGIAYALLPVAENELAQGNRSAALGYYRHAREIFTSLGLPRQVAWVDELIAAVG
jgi:hypothetical protein